MPKPQLIVVVPAMGNCWFVVPVIGLLAMVRTVVSSWGGMVCPGASCDAHGRNIGSWVMKMNMSMMGNSDVMAPSMNLSPRLFGFLTPIMSSASSIMPMAMSMAKGICRANRLL